MGDQQGDGAPRIDELMSYLDGTAYGADLRDITRRRQIVFDALANSTDRILSELGRQLRDETMELRDILRVPEYADVVFQVVRDEDRQPFHAALTALGWRVADGKPLDSRRKVL